MSTGPDDILHTYQQVGEAWDRQRPQTLHERAWLERFWAAAPGNRVLDLGCGAGRPIATWFVAHGARVTGVDGAQTMCEQLASNVPTARAIHADMRTLDLSERFDAILAWNSFFHLSRGAQREMFAIFAAHCAPNAVLMFTSGPKSGEEIGAVDGRAVYHASLDPADYRSLFETHGFSEMAFVVEDPDCDFQTIWMARYVGNVIDA